MYAQNYICRPVNSYGFQTNEAPDGQCQTLWKFTDEDKKWRELRARVISLTHSKLSKYDLGSRQVEEVHTIIETIKEEFVDLFPEDTQKEKRAHYIRQWVLKIHRGRRLNGRLRKARETSSSTASISANKENICPTVKSFFFSNVQAQPSEDVPAPTPSSCSEKPITSLVSSLASKNQYTAPISDSEKRISSDRSHMKTNANLLPLRINFGCQSGAGGTPSTPRATARGTGGPRGIPSLTTAYTRSGAQYKALDEYASPDNSEGSASVDPLVTVSPPKSPQGGTLSDYLPTASTTGTACDKLVPAETSTWTKGSSITSELDQLLLPIDNGSTPAAISGINQRTLLLNFLRACNPPMDHYHHLFVKAGCTNYQYLFALSTWPKEERRYFLATLGSTEGNLGCGSNPTEMDVLVMNELLEAVFGIDAKESK